MSFPKSKYLFSPDVSSFNLAKVPRTFVTKIDEQDHERTKSKDISKTKSDLIPHRDPSLPFMENAYMPYEVQSGEMDVSQQPELSSSNVWDDDDTASSAQEKKRAEIIESNWGGYGLDIQLWEDERAPIVNLRNMSEISLDELEFCGFLSDRLISAGSSFLTRSPETGRYILSKCIVRDMGITNITMLYYHRHLQYIDLAYNHISDLSSLRGIPYLMYLDVSHNRLKHVPGFTGSWYLTYFNLSYNYISRIGDFSSLWSIVRLDLSHNAIEAISGLQNLKYLQYLNLSYNLIETIENLNNLNIQELNLEGNCITSFSSHAANCGLKTLPNLRIILLGYNKISCLDFFQDACGIRLIDLRFNKIIDLLEVAKLKGSVYEIDLRGNPCTKWPNYRDLLLFSMPSLYFVDGSEVSAAEKVSAMTMFASPLDLVAARTVTKLTLLEQLHVPTIAEHVTPYDEVGPPLIILTGPSAVKKIGLGRHIAETLSKRVKYCQWHTTKKIEDEQEGNSYISVDREEFNEMTRSGDFLAVQELLGNSYGFHQEQIASLVRERKVGLTQMDLHATIQMKKRYSNVRAVLVITRDEEIHRNWARDKFDVYTWIQDSVQSLMAVKVGRHTEKNVSRSASSKLNFTQEIIHEIVDNMELPEHNGFVRQQGTGVTSMDTIFESRTMLPKVVLTRSQVERDGKKHITFAEEQSKSLDNVESLNPAELISEQRQKLKGLKVILDEKSNIIVEDEESKRRRQRAKILYQRSVVERTGELCLSSDDFDYSDSSDDTLFSESAFLLVEKEEPECLKEMYTDLVIKSRKIYLDYHTNKPGVFSLVLLTDDYFKAFNDLINFVYELYTTHSTRKPILLPEIEHLEHVTIPAATERILTEMHESLSSSVLQRKTQLKTYGVSSWKDLVPSQMAQALNEE